MPEMTIRINVFARRQCRRTRPAPNEWIMRTEDTDQHPDVRPDFTHTARVITGVESHGDVLVLKVSGDIGVGTAAQIVEVVDAMLERRPPAVVLDLSGVTFLSSAGLAALVDLHRRAAPETGFRVVARLPVVLRPLEISGLTELLTVRPSLAEALAADGERGPARG
jgi:anti-anti-sigma factor